LSQGMVRPWWKQHAKYCKVSKYQIKHHYVICMSYICPEIAIVMENAIRFWSHRIWGTPLVSDTNPTLQRQAFSGSTTLPSSESLCHWAKVWCLHKETEPISKLFNYVAFTDLRVQLANCLGRMYKLYTKSYKGFIFPRMLHLQQQLGWQIRRNFAAQSCPLIFFTPRIARRWSSTFTSYVTGWCTTDESMNIHQSG
jgi:hypothetical protein